MKEQMPSITKLPRFYADCHYDFLSEHVEAKISASSAGADPMAESSLFNTWERAVGLARS